MAFLFLVSMVCAFINVNFCNVILYIFLIFKNNSEFMLKRKVLNFFILRSFCNLIKVYAEIFNNSGTDKLSVHGGFFSLLCFIPAKSNLLFLLTGNLNPMDIVQKCAAAGCNVNVLIITLGFLSNGLLNVELLH